MLKVVAGLNGKDSGEIIYERKYRFPYVPEKFPVITMTAGAYLKYMADMVHSLGDRIYMIYERRFLQYENIPQTTYVIWIPEDRSRTPLEEMKKTGNGYYVYSDERTLSLDINRLQKEGWHIGKVYEDRKHDGV